jgi:hypothetical protein
MVIGDLNYDILTPDKSQVLDDLCDIFDLTNIVKNPTCFMKGYEPSLVDVILTNKNNLCFKTLNFNTGVSDCHHMISSFIKGNTPNCVNSKIQYRSFKDSYINHLVLSRITSYTIFARVLHSMSKRLRVNINSLRYKYDEIKDILLDKVVDCLIISQTILD